AARDGWRCAWKEISRSSAAWWRSLVRNVRSNTAIVAGARSPRLAPRKLAPWRLLEFFTGRVSRPSPQFHLHAPLHHRGCRCDVSFSRLVFLFQAYLPAHTRQRRRNAQFKTVQGLLHVTRDFTLISGTILRFSSTDEFVYSDIV